jgi:hypothetical protein
MNGATDQSGTVKIDSEPGCVNTTLVYFFSFACSHKNG